MTLRAPRELADLLDATSAVAPRAAWPAVRWRHAAGAYRDADALPAEVADLLDATLHVGLGRAGARGRERARGLALLAGPPLAAAALLLLGWEAWVQARDVPAYLLPAPSAIAGALAGDPARFAEAGWTTLREAIGGLALGGGAAFLLAVLMAHSRPLERALYPLALLVKVTPIIAVAPLFVIWFGFGVWPKLLIAALITFFPMLVNAVTGLRAIDPAAHDFMRVLHASRWQVFWRLRLPSSLPYLFAALRISIPLSLIGAVVAEWMSGDGGVGQVILVANGEFDTAALFGAVLVLAALAVALTAAVALAERRLLAWHESTRAN